MTQDDLITTLNDLIKTCKDGEEGFRTCSEHVHGESLKSLFASRAANCAISVRELQDLVRAKGGHPVDASSLSGTLHRSWIDVKAALTHQDDHALLVECERGEDLAVKNYTDALKKDLPVDIKSIVERQYHGVLQNHGAIKQLRDSTPAH